MFLGHFAVAFAAKRAAPKSSLGTLVAAASFIDVLWPALLAVGVERVRIAPGDTAFTPLDFERYPVSHSLLMVVVWSLLFGATYWLVTRYRRGAIVAGGLVLSHWFLDAVVHRPDLPLAPSAALLVGLGLWNSVPATLIVEGLMFAAGIWVYARATRSRDGAGRYGFAAFVAALVLIYAANVAGPPPPGVSAIAVAGLLGAAVLIAWSAWFDRHRAVSG